MIARTEMSWGAVWRPRVTAQLWREPAGRSIPRRRKLWMCDCRLWIDEWSVRASDQSRTNAVVVVTACLRHEWSRTGSNSVQSRVMLDMLKLLIWRRCAQEYAANEGKISSSKTIVWNRYDWDIKLGHFAHVTLTTILRSSANVEDAPISSSFLSPRPCL